MYKRQVFGGEQQKNIRSGTENVPGIAGLGLAAQMIYQDLDEKVNRMRELKQRFIAVSYTHLDVYKRQDQAVVHQYIQHWKIAKDFVVYLELYKKYRKDYGFDGILEGKWEKETLEKLNYAAFDERLSVVSLLLSQLNDRFLTLSLIHISTGIQSWMTGPW